MINQIYEQVVAGQEVRKNLIELRKLIKDEKGVYAFLYRLAGNYEVLNKLLEHEDAKVRKNAALIMGELGVESFLEPLFEAYEREEKLFVKADYLAAMRHLDYRPFIQQFKERLKVLSSQNFEEASMKHINEEIKVLREMILDIEGIKPHTFTGYSVPTELILLTHRDYQEITQQQLINADKDIQTKIFNAGILARTKNLKALLPVRTYEELLFRMKEVAVVENNPTLAAKRLWEGGLFTFLKERHEGGAPFYFRLELKIKEELDKKSSFAKKLAQEIEKQSEGALINSTSNYEVEIRLIENKEGNLNVLLKLYTLKDERFNYRKHAVAASIQPARAALLVELAKDYLKEDAQILDPFCGVGTMLIERNKKVAANPMYGIDSFGEAIDKAIVNAKSDEVLINFINRDFFDFKHAYLFDEIITNMPTRGGRKTEEDMVLLYRSFFKKCAEVLKQGAIMVMYSRDGHLVRENLIQNQNYKLLKHFPISKREKAELFILQYS